MEHRRGIGRPKSGNSGVGARAAEIATDPSSGEALCCGSAPEAQARIDQRQIGERLRRVQRTGTNREIKKRRRGAERKIVAAIGASFDVLEAEIPAFGTLHGS